MSAAGYYDHICLVYIHCVFLSWKDTLLQQQYRNGSTNKGLLSCLWDRDSLVLALGKTSCFADWFQSARKPIWSFRAVIANRKGRLYVVKRVFKSPKREGHAARETWKQLIEHVYFLVQLCILTALERGSYLGYTYYEILGWCPCLK